MRSAVDVVGGRKFLGPEIRWICSTRYITEQGRGDDGDGDGPVEDAERRALRWEGGSEIRLSVL